MPPAFSPPRAAVHEMGCSFSGVESATVKPQNGALAAPQQQRQRLNMSTYSGDDARWNRQRFDDIMCHVKDGVHAIALVRVGYLRHLAASGGLIPCRQDAPPDALHTGVPPDSLQMFKVTECWLDSTPDPRGDHLQALVQVLDKPAWSGGPPEAADADLVFFDWISCFQNTNEHKMTALQQELFTYVWDVANPVLHCYYRVRLVVLPHIPRWVDEQKAKVGGWQEGAASTPLIERMWPVQEMLLSSYCQRIVNSYDPEIMRGQDPERFSQIRTLFQSLTVKRTEHMRRQPKEMQLLRASRIPTFTDGADAAEALEAAFLRDCEMLLAQLRGLIATMLPVRNDAIGFETFCRNAGIAWVKVNFLQELVKRGGPFPRRQDLPAGRYTVGVPETGRKFVVSHGWEAEMHPSPSGSKLALLTDALARLGADDEDHVFFDYLSVPQGARCLSIDTYHRLNGGTPPVHEYNTTWYLQAGRDAGETLRFKFAMWDMGRLYAFEECEVVVLPRPHPTDGAPDRFPGGAYKWGRVKRTSYEQSGWCCAEYSIARYNGRIANPDDEAVREVEQSRNLCGGWPTSVAEYKAMMSDDAEFPVYFTDKGDRSVVAYNFFKMSFGLGALDI